MEVLIIHGKLCIDYQRKIMLLKALNFVEIMGSLLLCLLLLKQLKVMSTMDADLQDSPEEIPELYSMIKRWLSSCFGL